MDRRTFLKAALGAGLAVVPALRIFHAFSRPSPSINIHIHSEMGWQRDHAEALMAGFRRHGLHPYYAGYDTPCKSDIAVTWGWKQQRIIADSRKRGTHLLIMERGFIQPRMEWTSLAFDGLNGYGNFGPATNDGGERWRNHFAHLLQPWRKDKKGYALLIGQVPGDAALHGLDIDEWLQRKTNALLARRWNVMYRPHPNVRSQYTDLRGTLPVPVGATLSQSSLAEDLNGAAFTVIYDSTTAVESVLAGVPAVIESKGSVAWEMGSHDLDAPLIYPDRTHWCHELAWKQWRMEELADGSAWAHVRNAISI